MSYVLCAGAGTALCMLLKGLPHLMTETSAARVLYLLMNSQKQDSSDTASKPIHTAFYRMGLAKLLEDSFVQAPATIYGRSAYSKRRNQDCMTGRQIILWLLRAATR